MDLVFVLKWVKSALCIPSLCAIPVQCEQILLFLKSYLQQFSYKGSSKCDELLGYFEKHHLLLLCLWLLSEQLVEIFGLLA